MNAARRGHSALCIAFALGLAMAVAARPSRAQSASPEAVARVRELFGSGMVAMRAQRYAEALQAFSQAYALVPQPQLLLNLAGAQVLTGRLVAGAESYRRFLHDAAQGPAEVYRADAERALAEAERRTPRVSLRVAGLSGGERITLDGVVLERASLGEPLRVDPGGHTVLVVRDGAEVGRVAFALAEGETRDVQIRARPAVFRMQTPRDSRERPAQRTHAGPSPWPWIGVGAVVVTAAAVIGLAIVLSEPVAGDSAPINVR
jgi:hypothetical protein